MKKIALAAALVLSIGSNALAHDEGHGPKLSDTGKFGGLVSGVVLKADAKKGASAELHFKSELVRSADGSARMYIYDKEMKQLDSASFAKASAILFSQVKGKMKVKDFKFEAKESAFVAKLPKPDSKPFSIDATITKDGKEYLTAFDNLD